METVRFKAGEQLIQAQVLSQGDSISRHTGKSLVNLEVKFRADEGKQGVLQEALTCGTGTLLSSDGDASKDLTVSLQQTQNSYTVGNPIQTYVWTLTEKEQLELDELRMSDLNVKPYRYEEKFDGDALIINCRFKIDANQYQLLREMPDYFPVIRKGISDIPRSMRFGQILWSSEDDQVFKIKTTLVEEIRDSIHPNHGFLEPRFSNIMNHLAVNGARFAALADLLEEKGIITATEKENLFEVPNSERLNRIYNFDSLRDVDEWLD